MQKAEWPNVVVIVINWNGAPFIHRCLSALLKQTVAPYEIIVVDNASSDNSVDIVGQFPFVRLIALDRNTGFAGGNNLAIKAASDAAEWVALINPDAFVETDWLEKLLVAVKANQAFDVFGCKLVNAADTTVLDGTGDTYHMSGRVWRAGKGKQSIAETTGYEVFSPCAAAALYRRNALDKVGGFDEDFFCYLEDVDLGFRLRLAGYRCLYVPQAVAHHVGSGTTGGQHSDFSLYHGHRNLVWTFVKNMPGVLFWILLPLHLLLNLASIIWFTLQGRGGVILRAKRDAWLGLPKMWRKRQALMKNSVSSVGEIWRVLDKRLLRKL